MCQCANEGVCVFVSVSGLEKMYIIQVLGVQCHSDLPFCGVKMPLLTCGLDRGLIFSCFFFCPSIFVLLSLFISNGLFLRSETSSLVWQTKLYLCFGAQCPWFPVCINFTWALSLWNIRQLGRRVWGLAFVCFFCVYIGCVSVCQ